MFLYIWDYPDRNSGVIAISFSGSSGLGIEPQSHATPALAGGCPPPLDHVEALLLIIPCINLE